jgi:thiol-disulfide isomerase/thioredoxin
MSKFIALIIALFCFDYAFSQTISFYPEIGKPCPDFHFTEVRYYSRKAVSLKDFRGQWLMLDFWNRYCTVCLRRMPGTDSLQKKFSKQVQFILVGYTGSRYTHRSDNKPIHELYRKFRKRLNIDLPIAYDSLLFHRFDIGACPYIVIVDPKGIVRGVTTRLNEQNIKDLLSNKIPELDKAVNRKGF